MGETYDKVFDQAIARARGEDNKNLAALSDKGKDIAELGARRALACVFESIRTPSDTGGATNGVLDIPLDGQASTPQGEMEPWFWCVWTGDDWERTESRESAYRAEVDGHKVKPAYSQATVDHLVAEVKISNNLADMALGQRDEEQQISLSLCADVGELGQQLDAAEAQLSTIKQETRDECGGAVQQALADRKIDDAACLEVLDVIFQLGGKDDG